MAEEIDVDYQDKITCPYCGWQDGDSRETFGSDDGDGSTTVISCGNCGKNFEVVINVSVDYSSWFIEDKLKSEEDNLKRVQEQYEKNKIRGDYKLEWLELDDYEINHRLAEVEKVRKLVEENNKQEE